VASLRGATACAVHPKKRRWVSRCCSKQPCRHRALARGLTARQARLDALFHIIAVLDDSNLAHRGGLAGLRGAQRAAQGFLERGGIARPQGLREAQAIADDFVRQRLSPGGAADTLAAACWVQRLCSAP
jgi:triphosphoribosyl-dephospho-CoA synthase